jgi:hypothetical protein
VIDSGQWTDKVYGFCFPRLARRIWAGKGAAGSRPALQASRGRIGGGGKLFLVGVDALKHQIAAAWRGAVEFGSARRWSRRTSSSSAPTA